MLVGEVEQSLAHPRGHVVERVLGSVHDALALDPLVEVEDVDVLGAPFVGRARDPPGHVLLADVARDRDELAGLDVRPEDGELGELVLPRFDPAHGGNTLARMRAMRLNAYLARAGVASRRRADELIRGGRVRVNGEPGELNTAVGKHDVVEVDGARVAMPAARIPAPAQAGRSRHHGARSAGPGDRRRSRPVRSARRARRPPRRGHVGRPLAHERRRSRAPARAPALWRPEGLRGRHRGIAVASALDALATGSSSTTA